MLGTTVRLLVQPRELPIKSEGSAS
jgi:hypothetical protein